MQARKWQDGVSERAGTLAKLARRLKALSPWPQSSLPALWFLTDEGRPLDPVAAARALPPGSGIVLRHYRHAARGNLAKELAGIARERGLTLLIGADARLARDIGAHGVHLPQWAIKRRAAPKAHGLLTLSAHSARELQEAHRMRPDAVFLAPVFVTQSHEGAQALGAVRFSALVHKNAFPVIGLGGITPATAMRLIGSGAYGIGAIGALLPPTDEISG